MSERSLLDGPEGEVEMESVSQSVNNTVGEIKKRRGRPPGSRNRPKESEGIATNLENAIRGFFGLLAVIAGWFGYEQTEELTDAEAKEGARAFVPIAQKFPWFSTVAAYIGAPVWLLLMMRRKFARKVNRNEPVGSGGNRAPVADVVSIGAGETSEADGPN